MVRESCNCQRGLGLPHDHVVYWTVRDGVLQPGYSDEVRIWVDWKAVAKSLCASMTAMSSAPGNETSSMTPTSKRQSADA